MTAGRPAVSVVVPTYRRPELLARCLEALARQEAGTPEFETLVVDDGSGAATGEVLAAAGAQLPSLRYESQPENRGPAAARNRALGMARAPLVLFLDDDVVVSPGLVAGHARRHAARDERLGVLGLVEWHPDLEVTHFMRWLDRSGLQFGYDTWLREGPVDPPASACYTANLSIPRALLEQAGGFDERFPYPAFEDIELALRLTELGFHLEYYPALLAWHARSITLAQFCARMHRVGESSVLLREAQPEFPLAEHELEGGALPRRRRLALTVRVRWPGRGQEELRRRHYYAEVAAAYLAGRDQGRRALR